jgi:hypothetical protein
MSPKGPGMEGLVLNLRHYWELVEPLGGEAWWKEVRSLGLCPWRRYWKLDPSPLCVSDSESLCRYFSLSCSLWLPWGKRLCSTTYSCHDILPHSRPKSNKTNQPWTEAMIQSKPFFLICFCQVFCHSDKELTNIQGTGINMIMMTSIRKSKK